MSAADKQFGETVFIAATHRSGSYLLCDWLSQIADVPFAEEYFNFNLLSARQELRLSYDVPRSLALERLIHHKRSTEGRFAVKAMWPAFDVLFEEMAAEAGWPVKARFDCAFEVLGKSKFLFARRKNKAKQAVSFEKARQLNVWRSKRKDESLEETLVYNYARILECWEQLHADEASWLAFFKQHNLSYHEIWYEDMVANPMEQLGAVCDFLECNPLPGVNIESRYKKQSTGVNAEWTSAFQQRQAEGLALTEALSGEPIKAEVRISGGTRDAIQLKSGAAAVLRCELRNLGATPWCPRAKPDESSPFRVELRRVGEGLKAEEMVVWSTELETAVETGVSVELPLRIRLSVSFSEPQTFQLVFCHPDGETHCPESVVVEPVLDEGLAFFHRVFGTIEDSDMEGWIKVPVLGDVWLTKYPFIYNNEHGWLNVDHEKSEPGVFRANDFKMFYLILHLDEPNIYDVYDGKYTMTKFRFQGTIDGKRQFIDVETGEMVEFDLSY